MKRNSDLAVRKEVVALLRGGNAHIVPRDVLAAVPPKLRGARAPGTPHTPWQLLEHLRIAQWDILEFSVNPGHVSPEFPAGYWPPTDSPPTRTAWDRSLRQFEKDLAAMQRLVKRSSTDLYSPIPHGDGQTILREALLVADHNAYHLGQLVLVLRLLGAWQ